MILGANHVAMSVPDMEKALAFYCDVLGLEQRTELGWPKGSAEPDEILGIPTSARVCHVGTTNLLIELFEFADCEPQAQDPNRAVIDHGISHLCFAVTDVDAEYERLSTAGMQFLSDAPVQIVPGVKTVYGRDPFGNVLEFEEVAGRNIPNQPPVDQTIDR